MEDSIGVTLMIKSYRGLLADGEQGKIRLTTTDGRTGYRIVKFQIMLKTPGAGGGTESIVKIFKKEQTSIDGVIDFTDGTLLGAAYMTEQDNAPYVPGIVIVFDTEIFNQDIYVTQKDIDGSHPINYYIELEQIKLSSAQAELLIVKSLRGEVWTRP